VESSFQQIEELPPREHDRCGVVNRKTFANRLTSNRECRYESCKYNTRDHSNDFIALIHEEKQIPDDERASRTTDDPRHIADDIITSK